MEQRPAEPCSVGLTHMVPQTFRLQVGNPVMGGLTRCTTIGQLTRYEIVQVYRQEINPLADAGPRPMWYTGRRRSEVDLMPGDAQAQRCLRLQKEG
jgi:hypothetical protein